MLSESEQIRQANQRASIKWLLSKSFNNSIPDNLKDPFYKDHNNQERIKPQILVDLGNASLYCMTLSNLYSNPNYQNMNHSSILQILNRKGVPLADTPDMPVTETVLIHTNPIRIDAHIFVIESLMKLYTKEILSVDRVSNALKRISAKTLVEQQSGQNSEELIFAWIFHVCTALKRRISKELAFNLSGDNGAKLIIPDFPPLHDFQDICSGTFLALLISYYCPEKLPWNVVRISYFQEYEDTVYNCLLVTNFLEKYLQRYVLHINLEELIALQRTMKIHLVVLLADLFKLFEIRPLRNICYPDERGYVVHKSRSVATLSSVRLQQHLNQQEPLVPACLRQSKEKTNVMESKADERGDNVPAGRPSNWEKNRRPSYAGRRSRRNSSSEDSQLTIEHFGGSQDQLSGIEHNNVWEYERKLPSTNSAIVLRSSIADARGTLQLGYDADSGSEKQDCETEKFSLMQSQSFENVFLHPSSSDPSNISNSLAFQKPHSTTNKDRIDLRGLCYPETNPSFSPALNNSTYNSSEDEYNPKIKTSNSNSRKVNKCTISTQADQIDSFKEEMGSSFNKSDIRMKLEETRRRIEHDKRNIELVNTRHPELDHINCTSDSIKRESLDNEPKHSKNYESTLVDECQRPNMSQQYLTGDYQFTKPQHGHNCGSRPYLAHSFNLPNNTCSPRIPNRDHYQQYVLPQLIPLINEHGNYTVNQQPESSPFVITHTQFNPLHSMYSDGEIKLKCKYQFDPYSQYHYYTDYPEKNILSHTHEFDTYLQAHSPQVKAFYTDGPAPTSQQSSQWIWINSAHEQKAPIHNTHPLNVDVNALKYTQIQNAEILHDYNNKTRSDYNLENYGHYSEHEENNDIENHFEANSSPQHIAQPMYHHSPEQHPLSMTNLRENHSPDIIKSLPLNAKKTQTDEIMAPQSICFIGDEEDVEEIEKSIIESMQSTRLSDYNKYAILQQSQQNDIQTNALESAKNETKVNKFNITSGNLTYRIPSPSRPSVHARSYQVSHNGSYLNEKGFYISFDEDGPKRPKPLLRTKRTASTSLGNVDHTRTRDSISKIHKKFNENDVLVKKDFDDTKIYDSSKATYNKYTDPPINLSEVNNSYSQTANVQNSCDRRHLEDVTNQQQSQSCESNKKVLVIGADVTNLDADSVGQMEKRKEKIMLLSLQRRQQQEDTRARKEIEANLRRERERAKEEIRARKKEEQTVRRAAILEQHRLKKAIEEAECEGKMSEFNQSEFSTKQQNTIMPRLRQQRVTRPRPRTIHVDRQSVDVSESSSFSSRGKKGSNTNLTESPDEYPSTSSTPIVRRGSYKISREAPVDRGPALSRILVSRGCKLNFHGRKSNSLMNLCDTDSGLDRATPPRRAPSPGMIISSRHLRSPSGPGSLPPGLVSKRRGEDGSSDISVNINSVLEYSGPKLYKQPEAKSNRGIILNAVEYCVFPGVVNRDSKQRVLEKIARSEAKHFLVLFRDAGFQFRALYSYAPESNHVIKLYGTGPSQVDEVMFDKFFKYNSGGKCFSQVHTKHITVTIDAFTIHNSLWQGKKVHLPNKKDMALVI